MLKFPAGRDATATQPEPVAAIAPIISVIVETFTVCHEYPPNEAEIQLGAVLDRLREQRYPKSRTEILVVLDEVSESLAAFIQHKYPEVRTEFIKKGTYFSMKNHGFDVAGGEICALIDGDCIPSLDWLERMEAALPDGVDVVAGKTRYRQGFPFAKTFSVFDFGHVQADPHGKTFSFNLNNVGFRKNVVRENRLDERARRNGACLLLWRQLQVANYNMVYDPNVFAGHGNDYRGTGFIRKHIERGFDAINLFRISEAGLLTGSRYMRLGPLVPLGMFAARVRFDFWRMVSNRHDLGIPIYAIPYYYGVSIVIRGLEAAGGMTAVLKPDAFAED
jgi:glycosyltransferase involved in cell wall biosynthesis